MYCVNCGTPVTSNLSYCNRCGTSLKEKVESIKTGPITAFLTAITVIAISGLGIMFGGSLVLRTGAGFPFDLVAFFMVCTFMTIVATEVMLVRNLSKLTGASETKRKVTAAQQQPPLELRPQSTSTFEPIGSVTENTTRTLEYSRRDN